MIKNMDKRLRLTVGVVFIIGSFLVVLLVMIFVAWDNSIIIFGFYL